MCSMYTAFWTFLYIYTYPTPTVFPQRSVPCPETGDSSGCRYMYVYAYRVPRRRMGRYIQETRNLRGFRWDSTGGT